MFLRRILQLRFVETKQSNEEPSVPPFHVLNVMPGVPRADDDVVKSILKTIWSYNRLVSVIMQSTECNELQCNKADSTAKLFLSQLNTMDNHIATVNNNQATSESNHRSK